MSYISDFIQRTKNKAMEFDFISMSDDKKLDQLISTIKKELSQISSIPIFSSISKSLFDNIVSEVELYAVNQITCIKRLVHIGLALSSEKNIDKLLEMILDEVKIMANADAGTLYILDEKEKTLYFRILHNDTMKIRMGGTSGKKINLPNVPLYNTDGNPNYSNVSSFAALTGNTVNIPDVYEADGFDFTGPRNYDASTGYRSKSMIVIPLKNHENTIIGVLQLLNAKDTEKNTIVPFNKENEDLLGSLASQAAIALTNAQLIADLTNLFYSFIESIAAAIDEKSHYTGGHITRVVELSMIIAKKINEENEGPFKDVYFNQDEIEELKIAAWMHDIGKIVTPEFVVDKSSKLETIFDRIALIETRFNFIAKSIENDYLNKKVEILSSGKKLDENEIAFLDENMAKELNELFDDLKFVKNCNTPDEFMTNDKIERLNNIFLKKYKNGLYLLTEDELKNLSIRKGTLNDQERQIIENHARMTLKILKKLPFPKRLSKVPEYAGGHHEKLDGSGYPRKLSGKDLPLQSRIMAIADIFEALTASDRPYKKPMKLSQAVKIMGFMKKDSHIDPDIFDLFIGKGVYKEYAQRELNKDQID